MKTPSFKFSKAAAGTAGLSPGFLMLGLFGFYALYHLVMLSRSPLPWFDETFFASIAHSLLKSGRLLLDVEPAKDPFDTGLIYGPVYFQVQAGWLKIAGLEAFTFRLPALLCGLTVLFWFAERMRKILRQSRLAILFILLLALDPIFHQSLHSGRMDMMALMWVTGALGILLAFEEQAVKRFACLQGVLFGGFLVLAFLTTPRSLVLTAGLGALAAVRLFGRQRKAWLFFLLGALPAFVLPAAAWIFFACNGLQSWVQMYLQAGAAQRYLGVASAVSWHHIALGLLVVWLIACRGRRIFQGPHRVLVLICLANVAAFYALIKGFVLYSAMVLPFVYLLCLILLKEIQSGRCRRTALVLLTAVAAGHLNYFTAKNLVLCTQWAQRNPQVASKAVSRWIPRGSKVLGDKVYYYAVFENGSDYRYLTRKNRTGRGSFVQDFDYLIVSNDAVEENAKEVLFYKSHFRLEEVSKIKAPPFGRFAAFVNKVIVPLYDLEGSYEGTIYKRV